MKKKWLTLEDLVKFCESQKLYSFNSKDSGYKLSVQVPASFEEIENNDENPLMFVKVKAFHTGNNRNKSCVTEEAAKKAMKTMAYKPILANFATNPQTGELDFTSHDFEIDEDGNTIYLEKQVGCFTADKPYMEEDPDHKDRKYIYATAAIPRGYTAASEIIERKNGTKISVELIVNSMQYEAKEKILILSDIEVSGLTLLGINPETGDPIAEGMEGARLDIEDFSMKNNSICFSDTIELMQGLKETLDNYMTAFAESTKGGKTMEIFEENVETPEEEVVTEEVTEETVAEEVETETEGTEETIVTEAETEETTEVTPEEDSEKQDNFASFSVTVDGKTKTFSCSLVEKLNALYTLVNNTYSESDNDFYDVDADEEQKTVLMHGYISGKHYRQKYSVKKDTFSLQGDRCEVFATYMTKDEQDQFANMKANYSSISEKLAQYEAEPEKIEILNSDDYAQIKDTDEYAEISKKENYFTLSKEELVKKLDDTLLQYAKAGKLDFENKSDNKKNITFKPLLINTKKNKRYGNLLDGI